MADHQQILIVDDEPMGRKAFEALLNGQGYDLRYASDGPTALEMASASPPDLVLLDVMMAGMDGFEVTQRLRSNPTLADVPILLVTALDDPSSRIRGIEAGADDFVTKPFHRAEMLARVRSILRLNRFRRMVQMRESYQRLFESSPVGLMVVNQALEIQEINTVGKQMLMAWAGCNEPDSLQKLVSEYDRSQLQIFLDEVTRNTESHPRTEFKFQAADGSMQWLELTVSMFKKNSESAYQIALVDRTSERIMEEQLRQAEKDEALGQFVSGIAHDFNNLLTVINGFSSLAINILHPENALYDQIQQVLKAGERATALTRKLLTFSRREHQNLIELNLNSLLQESEKILGRLVGEHITLKFELAPTLGQIKADPSEIEQVIFNLVANARDAMPNGGTLFLHTQDCLLPLGTSKDSGERVRHVRLLVRDTGSGMSPEVLARLFQPFFTTKVKGKGTGLGLPTVNRIIRQLHGRIHVDSEINRGTQFTIDIPCQVGAPTESTPAPTTAPTPLHSQPRGGQETILIAEDDDSVRLLAASSLETAGYKILKAGDGVMALEIASQYPECIHLLFTDAIMPRLSGQLLIEEVRKIRPDIKVIYSSGYDDQTMSRKEDVTFLQKPFSVLRLRETVRQVLDQEHHNALA